MASTHDPVASCFSVALGPAALTVPLKRGGVYCRDAGLCVVAAKDEVRSRLVRRDLKHLLISLRQVLMCFNPRRIVLLKIAGENIKCGEHRPGHPF
jgi:hypothetical protein